MKGRSVIWIQRAFGTGRPRVSLEEPPGHPDARAGLDLDTSADKEMLAQMKTGPWGPNLVEAVGLSLYKLLTQHQAIKDDFNERFHPDAKEGPVYLMVEAPELDDLPWEALVDPRDGFVALDKRWPIARMKEVSGTKPEYVFLPPLRLMAVFGASGPDATTQISAEPEWDELFKGISNSGLNMKVLVLTCEDALKQRIDDLKLDWIETKFLQDDENLFHELDQFGPQVLHFFCHGVADTPPFLQISSRANWRRKAEGTIFVEAGQLRQMADVNGNVWLVTLNCCESAETAVGGGSRSRPLASSLVSHGFPAVIGMRERVDSMNANRFCGFWYTHLLKVFEERLASAVAGDGPSEFHWATALFAARQGICSAVESVPVAVGARRNREWTIPVLYTRSQPFAIRVAPDLDGTHPIKRPVAQAPPPVASTPAASTPGPPPAPTQMPAPAVPASPGTVTVTPPVPAPPRASSNGTGMALTQKIALVSEMQELLASRDKIAGQTNLPEAIRTGVLAEIAARLTAIEKQLS